MPYSYFYCTRNKADQPFLCLRMETNFLEADAKGTAYFKDRKYRDTIILKYRKFWHNWCVKYIIKKDLEKYFLKMPIISNDDEQTDD